MGINRFNVLYRKYSVSLASIYAKLHERDASEKISAVLKFKYFPFSQYHFLSNKNKFFVGYSTTFFSILVLYNNGGIVVHI